MFNCALDQNIMEVLFISKFLSVFEQLLVPEIVFIYIKKEHLCGLTQAGFCCMGDFGFLSFIFFSIIYRY